MCWSLKIFGSSRACLCHGIALSLFAHSTQVCHRSHEGSRYRQDGDGAFSLQPPSDQKKAGQILRNGSRPRLAWGTFLICANTQDHSWLWPSLCSYLFRSLKTKPWPHHPWASHLSYLIMPANHAHDYIHSSSLCQGNGFDSSSAGFNWVSLKHLPCPGVI